MELRKTNTKCAGVDVSKRWLDVAVHGYGRTTRVANDAAGIGELMSWLKDLGVRRVGMEATAGYERPLHDACVAAGFEAVLHQPLEIKLFARLKRLRAKTDAIDAVLIAAATAQVDAVKAAADPRLRELSERLTAYEFVSDQLASFKGFMEHVALKDVATPLRTHIHGLKALKLKLAAQILAHIKAHADLAERLKLLMSLPGVGPIVGASLIVRMPELGRMKRGQAAALLGVAPYARDTGQFKGQRFIGGGRRRPRRLLYLAALSAKRFDPTLKAFAQRLDANGKPAKRVVVAVMRKLIEAANLVLARGQPWLASAG